MGKGQTYRGGKTSGVGTGQTYRGGETSGVGAGQTSGGRGDFRGVHWKDFMKAERIQGWAQGRLQGAERIQGWDF